jgi:serine/threonine-protein kinase
MSPSAGTSGFADTEIKLVVSKGLPPVTVPSVTGVNMTTATNRLTKVGLKVSVKTVSCTGTRKGNVVTNQSASAGSQIATGSTVKITVAYICK